MTETDDLRRLVESLRAQNAQVSQRLAEAEQAIEALTRGEVDSVAIQGSTSPVLLQAAQETLRRSESLLRAVFDGSLDAKLLTDERGIFVDANPAACELFATARGDLLGRSLVEFAAPGYYEAAASDAFERQGGAPRPFPLQRPDGTKRILKQAAALANVLPGVHLLVFRDVTEFAAAEEALRASRTMLEEAQAIAHVGSWVSGFLPDGAIQWSREAARILDVAADAPMSVTAFFARVHPDDRELFTRASQAAIERGAPADVEHRIVRPDGSVRWVHQQGLVERDAAGQPIRFVGTIQDITERRKTEGLLRESEQRLALATQSARIGIWDWDVRRNAMLWDPQMIALYGVRAEGFSGAVDAWQIGVHPEDRRAAQSDLDAALRGEKPFNSEFRVVWPSGEVRSIEAHGLVQWAPDGSPTRMTGVNWDITARKRAEDGLRASEEDLRGKVALLRLAGHAARLGGWSVSLPDAHVTWSDEVCAIHEVAPGAAPGLEQALAYYPPEFRAFIGERFEECARDGTSFDVEVQIITAKGRRVWARAIGDAVRDASGVIVAVRGAFQDIDERRKLQEQFRQAQKMEAIGRLAGGVAHDFNNVLSVILGYANLALEYVKPGDPLHGDLREIETAGQRAAGLTRQLLAFSRQQVLQPRVLDLFEILAGMKSMLGRLLGEDVALHLPTAVGQHCILADPGQIEQVVMNLAVNARDAMPEGGTLTIEVTDVTVDASAADDSSDVPSGSYVMLRVVDTGTGMDGETKLHIFEPFFTTKEQGKGTGLGLATVFGIVQQSGGGIRVRSEVGRGTAFEIYLPRTEPSSDGPSIAQPTASIERGSETVLLVEDEVHVRALACSILRRSGYHVLEAANGGEAFLISREFAGEIQLLLTDVVMPRMSGRVLAEELAPQRPAMKVMFMSGYTDDAIVRHGVLASGVALLQKPFTPELLLRRVREVLAATGSIEIVTS